ncbi:MAG: hypothetical protein R2788_07705 [Saprospiraceae bacterium]
MKNRGNDYYSMNAMDAAAVVNQLAVLGNERAELILTENKGFKPDGSRHPHSWSIVDNGELVEWLLGSRVNKCFIQIMGAIRIIYSFINPPQKQLPLSPLSIEQ